MFAVAVAVAVWLTFDLMMLPTLDFGQRRDQGAWVGCAGRYFFTCGQFEGIWYDMGEIRPTYDQRAKSAKICALCHSVLVW